MPMCSTPTGCVRCWPRRVFRIPEQNIRVVSRDVGGGFGTKGWQYIEHRLTLWAARKVGRPVKWTSERSEAIQSDEHGRDNVTDAELAFDADGRIVGLRVRTIANIGAYLSAIRNLLSVFSNVGTLIGVYNVPAAHVAVTSVHSNTSPTAPYRGAGRPGSHLCDRADAGRGRAGTGNRPGRVAGPEHDRARRHAGEERAGA